MRSTLLFYSHKFFSYATISIVVEPSLIVRAWLLIVPSGFSSNSRGFLLYITI
nr:MAG TPA: hypothetical protein [Caudoviricetes sp.]